MTKIIPFRRLRALRIASRRRHEVRVRVIDADYPEETRWNFQRVVQNGGSFLANTGFTDANARRHRWHRFLVSDRLIARLARQSEPFVARRLVDVEIDGRPLRLVRRKVG